MAARFFSLGSNPEARCAQWFWVWIILRTLVWPLAVYWTTAAAPLDVAEMLVWGQSWLWGYHKHPPLPAWLADLAFQAFGRSLLGVYVLAYACTGVTIWAVWRLARDFLAPGLALLAALAVDGIVLYNLLSAEFNHNVLATTASALVALAFWRALKTGALRWWLALGVFAGLALLSKYSTVFLAGAIFAYLLLEPSARARWRTPGPYLALAVALVVFGPHLAWLAQEDFPTLRYARERAAMSEPVPAGQPAPNAGLMPRLAQAGNYLGHQAVALLPCVVGIGLFLSWQRRSLPPADRLYLATLMLGPLLLQIALSLALGFKLRSMWGMANWPWAGLFFLALWQHRPGLQTRLGVTLAGLSVLCLLLPPARLLMRNASSRAHRPDFPARALAEEVTRHWRERYHTPLPTVAGGFWLTGNILAFSADQPLAYASGGPEDPMPSTSASPWLDDAQFNRRGGVVVWEERIPAHISQTLAARYPRLSEPITLTIPFPNQRATPARIILAFLPPE